MQANTRLHFLHIPKTAGTSITQFLQRQYDLEQIVFETNWRELFKYHPRMRKLRLFRGHFGINLNKMLTPDFKTMTFLREPIARAISQYRHIHDTPTEGMHKFVSKMDLVEFMHHRQGRKLCRNLQTRYLGRDLEIGEIWANTRIISAPHDSFFEDLASLKLLENAKENLNKFFFVGLTEYYDISMLLLCHKLAALPELNAVKRRVRGGKTESLSKEVREHLKAENRLDTELYEYGKILLVQDIAREFGMPDILQMSPDKALEHANQKRDELLDTCLSSYAKRMRKEQQENWHWDVTQAFQGAGWWDVHGRLGETPHRWSGPQARSVIDAPVDPKIDYEIVVRVLKFMTPTLRKAFEVRASNERVSLNAVAIRGDEWEFRGLVRGQEIEDSFLRLTFSVPETRSMAELGFNPNDTDKRGFALRSVSLKPLQH